MKRIKILLFIILVLALIGCNLENAKNEVSYKENKLVSDFVDNDLTSLMYKNFLYKDMINELIYNMLPGIMPVVGVPSDISNEEFNDFVKKVEVCLGRDLISEFTNIDIHTETKKFMKGEIDASKYNEAVVENLKKLISSDEGIKIKKLGNLSYKDKDGNIEINIDNLSLETLLKYFHIYEQEFVYTINDSNVVGIKVKDLLPRFEKVAAIIDYLKKTKKKIEIYDTSLNVTSLLTKDNYSEPFIVAKDLEAVKGNKIIDIRIQAKIDDREILLVYTSTVNSELKGKCTKNINGEDVEVYPFSTDNSYNLTNSFKAYTKNGNFNDIIEEIAAIAGPIVMIAQL